MTAPTDIFDESDIVQLRDRRISLTGAVEYKINGNPPVFENGGDGGPQRPTSGIVYP